MGRGGGGGKKGRELGRRRYVSRELDKKLHLLKLCIFNCTHS